MSSTRATGVETCSGPVIKYILCQLVRVLDQRDTYAECVNLEPFLFDPSTRPRNTESSDRMPQLCFSLSRYVFFHLSRHFSRAC